MNNPKTAEQINGPQIYLAARYSRREELCGYRAQLQAMRYNVQARWLNGEHQLATDGTPIGESGESLVEGTLRSGEIVSERDKTEKAASLRSQFANDDWEDVTEADVVISFTEPPRSTANRGGRHVEFGIALARNARVIVVGHRENIFHWLPSVEFCENWEQALSLVSTFRNHRPNSRISELETLVSNLRRDLQKAMEQNRKLRAALEKWKAYCSDESTEPSIANEETGEAFSDAYFEMMEALKP